MKEKAQAPQLRFEGFTDDWEERKLKELFQPSKNKNNNGLYNQKDILAASLGTELIPKRTFFGLKSTKESVKNYRIVKTGDLIYTKSPIKGFPNGIIRSNKGNVGIVPPLYCVYTLQKDINSSIIQLYFEDKNRLDLYLFPLVNVGARNNVNITDLEFLEGKVTIPKSYEEQSKIVQFMEQLNRTIDLHQRKLDLLKEQKKGYLQKMFPKNGAKVPELRFAGFADDWEDCKLEEVLRERNNQQSQSLENPLVSFTVEKGVTPKTDRYEREQLVVGDKSSKKYKVTVLNDIVYNPANLKFGAISRNKYGNAVFSPIYITFVVNNDVTTPEFIEMFVTRNDFIKRALKYQQGTVYERQSVSPADLLSMVLYLPGKAEQEKIGSFFKQLDDTIDLHQRKLDLLKEQKKGFLQKMFV